MGAPVFLASVFGAKMVLSAVARFVFGFLKMAALASYTFIAFGGADGGLAWRRHVVGRELAQICEGS